MTTKEAATRMGCSQRFVVKLIAAGQLVAKKNKYRQWEVHALSVSTHIKRTRNKILLRLQKYNPAAPPEIT